MKTKIFALIMTMAFAIGAQAEGLKCESDTSQSIKELVSVLKMKQKLPKEMVEQMSEQMKAATSCDEIDKMNLALVGFAISSMP